MVTISYYEVNGQETNRKFPEGQKNDSSINAGHSFTHTRNRTVQEETPEKLCA